jgi:hypothetical protein
VRLSNRTDAALHPAAADSSRTLRLSFHEDNSMVHQVETMYSGLDHLLFPEDVDQTQTVSLGLDDVNLRQD